MELFLKHLTLNKECYFDTLDYLNYQFEELENNILLLYFV